MDIQAIINTVLSSDNSIYILLAVASVLFVVGILLLFKATDAQEQEKVENVVPISDPKQIKELTQEYEKSQSESLSNLRMPVVKEEKPEQIREIIKAQEDALQSTNPIEEESKEQEIKEELVEEVKEQALPQEQKEISDETVKEEVVEKPVEKALDPQREKELQDEISGLQKALQENKDAMNAQLKDLEAKNKDLKDALEKEVSSKDQTTLNKYEKDLIKEKDERIQRAEGSLVRLTGENHRLSKELEALKQKYAGAQMADIVESRQEKVSIEQVEDLEKQLQEIKNENAQLKEAAVTLDHMKQENEQLQHNVLENAKMVEELKAKQESLLKEKERDSQGVAHLDALKNEKEALLNQVKIQEEKARALQSELKVMRSAHEQEVISQQTNMDELKQRINALEEEKERIFREQVEQKTEQEPVAVDTQNAQSEQMIKDLTQQKDDLTSLCRELKQSNERLEKFNKQLLDKEQVLHYELSKMRAQSIGLEKVCEDFKQQVEKLSAKS